MERIVFLDIDGVLGYEEYYINCKTREGDTFFIDPEKVKLLNKLKDVPNISIVISSSWGTTADSPLKNLGLEIPINGHTEHFHYDFICRGNEIEKYLVDKFDGIGTKWKSLQKANDLYRYVIIDDDDDMLLGQKDNFISVDPFIGLTENDIETAKSILMK